MDNKNKNYKRIDKIIIETFISLCETESYENISISTLCEKADINRTTFYNHFNGIWEIIEVIENEIIEKLDKVLESFRYREFVQNPYPVLSKLNDIINEKTEYYHRLFDLSASRFFLDKTKDVFIKKILEDTDIPTSFAKSNRGKAIVSIFIGGLISVYSDWFNNEIECSLEEITQFLVEYISKSAPIIKN